MSSLDPPRGERMAGSNDYFLLLVAEKVNFLQPDGRYWKIFFQGNENHGVIFHFSLSAGWFLPRLAGEKIESLKFQSTRHQELVILSKGCFWRWVCKKHTINWDEICLKKNKCKSAFTTVRNKTKEKITRSNIWSFSLYQKSVFYIKCVWCAYFTVIYIKYPVALSKDISTSIIFPKRRFVIFKTFTMHFFFQFDKATVDNISSGKSGKFAEFTE